MFNKQFRKGVKEINDAIICEMQAYIIVACSNVYNKTAPKFVKPQCKQMQFMCKRAVGLGSASKKTFLNINKKKMIMLLFLRNAIKILTAEQFLSSG